MDVSQAYGGDGGAGLLSLREDKALHEPVVTSVNRRHPLFTQFRPWPLAAAAGASQPADAPAAEAAPAEPGTIPAGVCPHVKHGTAFSILCPGTDG